MNKRSIVNVRIPGGIGKLKLKKRKRGLGVKGKVGVAGVLGSGGRVGVSSRGVNAGGNVSFGKLKGGVGGRLNTKGKLRAKVSGGLKFRKHALAEAGINTGITKKEAFAGGKVDLLGVGGKIKGGVGYNKGIPSVGGSGSLKFGKQRLGGGIKLGGPKIINVDLTLPFFGKVINLHKNKKTTTKRAKSTTKRTKSTTKRTKSTRRKTR